MTLGAFYGVMARLLFDSPSSSPNVLFAVMTLGFLFGAPLGVGAATVYFLDETRRARWVNVVFLPWASVLLLLATVALIKIEGTICIILGLPLFLVMSSVGGVLVIVIARLSKGRGAGGETTALMFALVLPFVISPLERGLTTADEVRTIETTRTIAAPASVVWPNIVNVRTIGDRERPIGMAHRIGLPDPLEALLDREAVGGVRRARFSGGLEFLEHITRIVPEHLLAFSITANGSEISPDVLDRHVLVGGEYFDVLDGGFSIEPLDTRHVRLHLVSHHRLSTHFNAYAGLWTDSIMRDVQETLLTVIQKRCELRAGTNRLP